VGATAAANLYTSAEASGFRASHPDLTTMLKLEPSKKQILVENEMLEIQLLNKNQNLQRSL
jgi:hypothetical protein